MMRDAKLAGIKRDLGTMVGHACTTCIGVLTPRGKDEGCSLSKHQPKPLCDRCSHAVSLFDMLLITTQSTQTPEIFSAIQFLKLLCHTVFSAQ